MADITFPGLVDGGKFSNVSGAIALNSAGTLLAVSPNGRYGSVCPNTNGYSTCVLLYTRTGNSWAFSEIMTNSLSSERFSAIDMAWGLTTDTLYAYDNVTRKFWELRGPSARTTLNLAAVTFVSDSYLCSLSKWRRHSTWSLRW
jgi:hypothetical protein